MLFLASVIFVSCLLLVQVVSSRLVLFHCLVPMVLFQVIRSSIGCEAIVSKTFLNCRPLFVVSQTVLVYTASVLVPYVVFLRFVSATSSGLLFELFPGDVFLMLTLPKGRLRLCP